jgi:hypothetical protein
MDEEIFSYCEACSKPIGFDEPFHSGADVNLCARCAPDYDDLLNSPESFQDSEGEPLTTTAAKEIYDAHMAAGGRPSDKIGIPPT